MLNRKGGKWEGGYVSMGKGGRETFVIERRVRTKRFHVATRATSRRAALKQLERFEADPSNYRPEGEALGEVRITKELVLQFADFLEKEKGNTPKYCKETSNRLADWIEDIGHLDLRHLSLRDHLRPALKQRGGARHRIITIKSFMTWMRREKHLVRTAEDVTLDLPVPQPPPAKHKKRKAVAWQNVAEAAKHLDGAYLDVLQLLVATGMHVTELERFIRRDDSALVVPLKKTLSQMGKRVLGVLATKHKSGATTRTPLTMRMHVEAAQRLRAAGVMPRKLNAALKAACDAAEVPRFTAGVMRHSVATWAIEKGATPEVVAEFLGHRDKRTTLRFYADVSVPTNAIPTNVIRLR